MKLDKYLTEAVGGTAWNKIWSNLDSDTKQAINKFENELDLEIKHTKMLNSIIEGVYDAGYKEGSYLGQRKVKTWEV